MADEVIGSARWCQKRILTESGVGLPKALPYGTALSKSVVVGISHISSPDTGEVCLHPFLLTLMDKMAEMTESVPEIVAGYMTSGYRRDRSAIGLESKVFMSHHEIGAALRIAMPSGRKVRSIFPVGQMERELIQAAAKAGLPLPTIISSASFVTVSYARQMFIPLGKASSPLKWPELSAEARETFASWGVTR